MSLYSSKATCEKKMSILRLEDFVSLSLSCFTSTNFLDTFRYDAVYHLTVISRSSATPATRFHLSWLSSSSSSKLHQSFFPDLRPLSVGSFEDSIQHIQHFLQHMITALYRLVLPLWFTFLEPFLSFPLPCPSRLLLCNVQETTRMWIDCGWRNFNNL